MKAKTFLWITMGCALSMAATSRLWPQIQPKTNTLAKGETRPKFKAIWEPVNYQEDVELMDMAFVSDLEGWVAGGASVLKGGVILHTTDGGDHWTLQLGDPKSADRAYRSLRFVDAKHGWAVQGTSSKANLLGTTDGERWAPVGTIAENYVDYAFTTPTSGVYLAKNQIFQTADGGHTWRSVAACQAKVEVNGLTRNVGCEFAALHFPSPQVGYAVAFSYQVRDVFFVLKTQDGGATWDTAQLPPLPDKLPLQGFYVLDPQTAWAVGTRGAILITADGGTTWHLQTSGTSRDLAGIHFTDRQHGWAVGFANTILKTTDGGQTWTKVDDDLKNWRP